MSRVYVVDDHTIVRDGLRAMLESAGHEVVGEAIEPTAALADVLRLKPQVLLLDLGLDDRSGFELLSELRRRKATVRTLVLTMSSQPRHVVEALRLGACGYVLKDASRAELLAAIGAVHAGQRHLGRDVAELAADALVAEANTDPLNALSPREQQIITLVARGHTSQSIAGTLHLSPKTIETYRSRLMTKLDIADVPALVRFAIRNGLVDADVR